MNYIVNFRLQLGTKLCNYLEQEIVLTEWCIWGELKGLVRVCPCIFHVNTIGPINPVLTNFVPCFGKGYQNCMMVNMGLATPGQIKKDKANEALGKNCNYNKDDWLSKSCTGTINMCT